MKARRLCRDVAWSFFNNTHGMKSKTFDLVKKDGLRFIKATKSKSWLNYHSFGNHSRGSISDP